MRWHNLYLGCISSFRIPVQPPWKWVRWFPKKLEIDPLCDLNIPLLDINTEISVLFYRDDCSSIFTSALFLIARKLKHPRYPQIVEWVKKILYAYLVENENMKFTVKWIELEIFTPSEITQTQKDKYSCFLSFVNVNF